MARVNVFLPDELLERVEREARQSGLRRSRLIQAALESWLQARRREREEAEARCRREAACAAMDELAERLGDWDPTEVIRRFRDERAAAAAVAEPAPPRRKR